MLARAIAKYLTTLGIVDYRDQTAGGDCFLAHMPSSPDVAVMVMPYGGLEQRTRSSVDLPIVQLIIRGERNDPLGGLERARAAYAALACLDGQTLDDGGDDEVHVIGCTPAQSGPIPLGMDENQRHEWSLNFDFRISNPTTHRPAFSGT